MIEESIIKNEEKIILQLRSLYSRYGYFPYKMSKFEEYEFYIQNKDFLVSDKVIAFNDTDGKLMALKPDVTLSVIRSAEACPGVKQKLYYNENVYRATDSSNGFKEIMQAGVECIGDNDFYDIYEVISLAKKSLECISPNHMLVVSHLGLLSDILCEICPDPSFSKNALPLIEKKSIHELSELFSSYEIGKEKLEKIECLLNLGGSFEACAEVVCEMTNSTFANELKTLASLLGDDKNVRFDFSLVNNLNYYNGFVFKGYIEGIFDRVLAGGQYDRLIEKLGKKSGAIGFAIYLNMLDSLESAYEKKVDIILLYDDKTGTATVAKEAEKITKEGKTVLASKNIPEGIKYDSVIDLKGGRNA